MAKQRCDHYWSYEHAVYSGNKNTILVRRWCHRCGAIREGTVRDWRKSVVGLRGFTEYPDGYPQRFKQ